MQRGGVGRVQRGGRDQDRGGGPRQEGRGESEDDEEVEAKYQPELCQEGSRVPDDCIV